MLTIAIFKAQLFEHFKMSFISVNIPAYHLVQISPLNHWKTTKYFAPYWSSQICIKKCTEVLSCNKGVSKGTGCIQVSSTQVQRKMSIQQFNAKLKFWKTVTYFSLLPTANIYPIKEHMLETLPPTIAYKPNVSFSLLISLA